MHSASPVACPCQGPGAHGSPSAQETEYRRLVGCLIARFFGVLEPLATPVDLGDNYIDRALRARSVNRAAQAHYEMVRS